MKTNGLRADQSARSGRGQRHGPTTGRPRTDARGVIARTWLLLVLALLAPGAGATTVGSPSDGGSTRDDAARAGDADVEHGTPELVQAEPDTEPVPPLLLDPRPESHAKSGKPSWSVDPENSIRWVVVVRHAEKASEPEADPPLTPQGEERAELLRRLLSEAGPTLLLGTELIRSQRTLEPLAAELGLLVDIHESDDPYGMAERIRELDRPVSVVSAHSDTVIPILQGLTGLDLENLAPIAYDDLFVVAIAPGVATPSGRAAASVLRLQYGPED